MHAVVAFAFDSRQDLAVHPFTTENKDKLINMEHYTAEQQNMYIASQHSHYTKKEKFTIHHLLFKWFNSEVKKYLAIQFFLMKAT